MREESSYNNLREKLLKLLNEKEKKAQYKLSLALSYIKHVEDQAIFHFTGDHFIQIEAKLIKKNSDDEDPNKTFWSKIIQELSKDQKIPDLAVFQDLIYLNMSKTINLNKKEPIYIHYFEFNGFESYLIGEKFVYNNYDLNSLEKNLIKEQRSSTRNEKHIEFVSMMSLN